MKLHAPFIISARLLPALRIGTATLSLVSVSNAGKRQKTEFVFDFEDGTSYTDATLKSGCTGFRSPVEAFEVLLSFLSYAASMEYEDRQHNPLFPEHVEQWAADNLSNIETAQCDLCDENGTINASLIEP